MISERILKARMAEVGRIKIGGLNEEIRKTGDKEWQAPKKFEHFVITGMDKDKTNNFIKDEAIHTIIGQTPRELKIRLLYNDIDLNFRTELALYQGKTCACRGNGETAQRLDMQTGELIEVSCPCPKLEQEKGGCKPHGTLQCLLEQASLCGGVHKFATTGWNTISSIVSSLKFIQACTGGKIAGLPLTLKYFKKATTKKDGKATTIPVVTVVYEGNPVQMLESAIKTERQRLEAGIQLETLEVQVRREMKNLEITGPLDDDDIPEFHPEIEEEDDAPPAKTIGQAIFAAAAEPAQPKAPVAEPAKPEAPKKTVKATEPKTTEPKTKTAPTAEPAKTEAKSTEAVAVSTPAPITTASISTQTGIPARSELQREITSLRAKLRIITADWQAMVNAIGITDLNAAAWSDETMFKVLLALRAKGA